MEKEEKKENTICSKSEGIITNESNIIICKNPKDSWQHTFGVHLTGSDSIAFFPEECLFLVCNRKLYIQGCNSISELIKIFCQYSNIAEPATIFTLRLFNLYKHLRLNSHIPHRENPEQIIETLNHNGYNFPIKKKKKEEEKTKENKIIYSVYSTKTELKEKSPKFRVSLSKEEDNLTLDEMQSFSKESIKLGIVKENKIIILNITTSF